ncbi:MAG: sugar phosphate isomerase/epimerase family protein [Oscillospiraceae bacterium]
MKKQMQAGVSSACFYPMPLAQSLRLLGENGINCCEVFFNTFSEFSPDALRELRGILDTYGMQVPSIHPFTSEWEYLFFFSEYPGRLEDGLELYRRIFDAAQQLGAHVMVFHGDRLKGTCSIGTYAERYRILNNLGQQFGVTVCQENVPRTRCSSLDFIRALRRELHDEIAFTADFKQALRSGMEISQMLNAMGSCLRHIHISDNSPDSDCLAPGAGTLDFIKILSQLDGLGGVDTLMIELYSKSFGSPQDLAESWRFLSNIIESVQN